jgi:hypothetical protein
MSSWGKMKRRIFNKIGNLDLYVVEWEIEIGNLKIVSFNSS